MDWLEPWYSTEFEDANVRRAVAEQLAKETSPGHPLHGLSVKLIARGKGDDALFEILDGSGRVAEVHLVWQGRQTPPWPMTGLYTNLDEWRVVRMIPDHKDWKVQE